MSEIWKPIPGFEGRYEASSLGRIRSLPNKRRFTTIILKQQIHKRTGYALVNLTTHDGTRWRQVGRWVARLICETFHGPCPIGMEACHNDGQKLNNAESNLRWDTPASNQADRAKHGTANIGSQNPLAKLNEITARAVKTKLKAGASVHDIAMEFSVAASTIKNVKNGYSWRHVDV